MVFIGKRRCRRKSQCSARHKRNAAVVVALLAFLLVSAYEFAHFAAAAQLRPAAWRKPWGGIERYEPAPDYRAARAVYPYSVVPGGVQSETEVAASMAKDPVVARHYRDIQPERLHGTRLSTAMDVYASYRTSNSVHWTSHTIRIQKGELVLSDGANLVRARCGNRLSFTPPPEEAAPPHVPSEKPQTPGLPPVEPPELVFDRGMPPVLNSPGLPSPPLVGQAPPSESAHFWPPAGEPPNWCCVPGGFPGNWYPAHPGHSGHPESRPPAIPEPTTGLLLGPGAFVMLIRLARRVYR
jgi:hypothetical protein